MELVKSHQQGDNITILNTISKKFADPDGNFHEGLIIVYKDYDTGLKYKEEIVDPDYTFYKIMRGKKKPYNQLFVPLTDLCPITVTHTDIDHTIAEVTDNKQFFFDNLRAGNKGENAKLHAHPDIFGSDINIEDYYRHEFDMQYKNEPGAVTKSYLDIEADTISMLGDFPQPGECPINAVTVIFKDLNKVFTFLLETNANPLIPEFKKTVTDGTVFPELKAFVENAVGGPDVAAKYGIDKFEYNFLFYPEDKEINLIKDIFSAINNFKPDFCLAWNMAFDIPYIIARIRNLGYEPKDIMCHPDFGLKFCEYFVDERMKNEFAERGDYALISSYTVFVDQMIQYASRRKGQARPISFGLDYIGEIVAKVHKLDYKHITTNISELPYKDYKTFVFYNIMDVIVQVCIESKTGDIDYMYSKAIVNNTRYAKVHRQTVYLTNRGIKEFRKSGYIMGNNVNKFNDKPDTKFPGAFVADPVRVNEHSKVKLAGIPIWVFNNLNDFDKSIVA